MVIGWLGWASRAAWPASSARAATSTSGRRAEGGVQVVHAGGGQELLQQPLQLLALPVGHPEQLLLLGTWERLGVVLQGHQGAKQRGQRLAQLVGDHGQQLLGVLTGWLLAWERLVGHRSSCVLLWAARERGWARAAGTGDLFLTSR
jgi:hypothetical protein